MANELTLTAALGYAKGTFTNLTRSFTNVSRDVAGSNPIYNVQAVGTSAEALLVGDVGTAGYILLRNLDATNFVEVRDGAGGADVVKLKPGDIAMFRLATSTPFVIADTAGINLEYWLIPD